MSAMSRRTQPQRQSAKSRFFELGAVFSVSLVVVAVVMHYAIPWVDVPQAIGEFIPLVADYPIILVLILGLPALVFVFASIRDYFAP